MGILDSGSLLAGLAGGARGLGQHTLIQLQDRLAREDQQRQFAQQMQQQLARQEFLQAIEARREEADIAGGARSEDRLLGAEARGGIQRALEAGILPENRALSGLLSKGQAGEVPLDLLRAGAGDAAAGLGSFNRAQRERVEGQQEVEAGIRREDRELNREDIRSRIDARDNPQFAPERPISPRERAGFVLQVQKFYQSQVDDIDAQVAGLLSDEFIPDEQKAPQVELLQKQREQAAARASLEGAQVAVDELLSAPSAEGGGGGSGEVEITEEVLNGMADAGAAAGDSVEVIARDLEDAGAPPGVALRKAQEALEKVNQGVGALPPIAPALPAPPAAPALALPGNAPGGRRPPNRGDVEAIRQLLQRFQSNARDQAFGG